MNEICSLPSRTYNAFSFRLGHWSHLSRQIVTVSSSSGDSWGVFRPLRYLIFARNRSVSVWIPTSIAYALKGPASAGLLGVVAQRV